jgi:hypothetical protein
VALAIGKVAVQHGHARAEAADKALHCLRRECNLWHEDDRALSRLQQFIDGLQIHLRLAAACHAVEQQHRRQSLALRGGEGEGS